MLELENLTLDEIINGYSFNKQKNAYECIVCGKSFEDGEIFKIGERFFDCIRAVQMHVAEEHTNRLNELYTDTKYLSLTENQKELLLLISDGLTDKEIAKKLSLSPSTVRHQRFLFREKAKAAKIYLAVWEMAAVGLRKNNNSSNELLHGKNAFLPCNNEFLPLHGGAVMVDERYEITEEESKKIINGVFESLNPLKLKVFSTKEKKKIVTLRLISQQFDKNKHYTEKEVNAILSEIFDDYVTLRRYLIAYGYMDRTRDGSDYWMK